VGGTIFMTPSREKQTPFGSRHSFSSNQGGANPRSTSKLKTTPQPTFRSSQAIGSTCPPSTFKSSRVKPPTANTPQIKKSQSYASPQKAFSYHSPQPSNKLANNLKTTPVSTLARGIKMTSQVPNKGPGNSALKSSETLRSKRQSTLTCYQINLSDVSETFENPPEQQQNEEISENITASPAPAKPLKIEATDIQLSNSKPRMASDTLKPKAEVECHAPEQTRSPSIEKESQPNKQSVLSESPPKVPNHQTSPPQNK